MTPENNWRQAILCRSHRLFLPARLAAKQHTARAASAASLAAALPTCVGAFVRLEVGALGVDLAAAGVVAAVGLFPASLGRRLAGGLLAVRGGQVGEHAVVDVRRAGQRHGGG